MQRINKLFRFFLKIDAKKYKDISLWLSSSYQKADADVILLWEYLLKHPPKYEDSKIDSVSFFENVFPQQAYNDAKLRNSMSNLINQWVLYWKYQWVISNNMASLEFANDLSYDNPFLDDMVPILKNVEKILLNEKYYSIDHFYTWYLLRKIQIYANNLDNLEGLNKMMHRLKQSIDTLDEFYLTAQIKHHLIITLNSMHINTTDESFIISTSELLSHIEKKVTLLEKNPLLNMYYLILKTYFSKNEDDLNNLLILYNEKVLSHFSINDFSLVSNSIPSIINLNKTPHRKQLKLDFIVKELEISAIKGGSPYILASKIYMVIRMGIDIYGVKWVQNFIAEKKEHIEREYKDTTLVLTKALCELYLGNYRRAFSALLTYNNNDNLMLNIHYHILKMMVSYKIVENENDSLNELLNAVNSFKTFIKNDTTSGQASKSGQIAFIEIITSLAKTPVHLKPKLEKLQEHCMRQNTREKDWLLSEIALKISRDL